jgi:Sulfotransferase domain
LSMRLRVREMVPRSWRRGVRRGVLSPWDRQRDRRQFRKNVRPTDVFIVGHPKSGNTWISYMLAVILEDGDVERHVTMANIGYFIPAIHGSDSKISSNDAPFDPRIFRNEWPTHPSLYPRTLYLVRDPRAVLVSYYHHYRVTTGDSATSLDAFIEMYLRDGCIRSWEPRLVRWDEQVADWMRRMNRQPVMIVKYETVHRDRRSILRNVTRFCGIRTSEDTIAMAEERGTFEAMRLDEQQSGAEAYPQEPGRRGWFLRRGLVDAWKEELSFDSREAIEAAFQPVMKAIGYPLDS